MSDKPSRILELAREACELHGPDHNVYQNCTCARNESALRTFGEEMAAHLEDLASAEDERTIGIPTTGEYPAGLRKGAAAIRERLK